MVGVPNRDPVSPGGARSHGRALALIPAGLIVAVCVVDVLAPPDIHLGPLLVAAPAFAAAFAGPRLVAAIGAMAIIGQIAIGVARGVLTTENLQAQTAALVLVSFFVVVFCLVRERRERELARTQSIAAVAQKVLLRPLPRHSGPLEVASLYLAAEEEAGMGGDLFAITRTARGTRLVIGDVRGKGLPAYSLAALLLGAFHAAAHRQATLPNLAIHLDGAVRWDTNPAESDQGPYRDGSFETESFATAMLLDVPDTSAVVRIINCGHPPPILLRRGGARELSPRYSSLPIGLGGLAAGEHPDYDVETFPFEVDDTLLLYTDGVIEARSPHGEFYPLAERAAAWTKDSPQELLDHLHDDLIAHTHGRLGDDAAAVALRRSPTTGESPAPPGALSGGA